MYIYEMPFKVNKEFCRLLDNDNDWKELAGTYMKYSAFEVNEIEQEALRQGISPTKQLLIRWGQLNHKVKELMVLMYHMEHIPAMQCLISLVEPKCQLLLEKLQRRYKDGPSVNGNANNKQRNQMRSDSSLPLPVMLIEKGVHLPSSSNEYKGTTKNDSTTTNESTTAESEQTSSNNVNEEILKNVSAIPRMTFEDLREATNDWSNDNLLGRGGFGQVFKGEWKYLPIAVKRLRKLEDGSHTELIRELCLNQYRHDNILPLYGYSLGGPEACLVYQLMLGGSLEQRLRCKEKNLVPLTWSQRYRIAHGVARGLQYLHRMEDKPLIHGDIKPANILLDQCMVPKIGDFGLARKGPYDNSHLKVSRIHGTRPYLPEEYLRGGCLSPAVDVFSFGVLIVEIASNLSAVVKKGNKEQLLSDFITKQPTYAFASLEDPMLINTPHSNPNLCREFIWIGVKCTSLDRQQRPKMIEVYTRLDNLQLVNKNDENDDGLGPMM